MYAGIRSGGNELAKLFSEGPASIDPGRIFDKIPQAAPIRPILSPRLQELVHPRLIGLAAPARAGKDTVGGILRTHAAAQSVAFAEPIRSALRAMIPGLTEEHIHGKLKEVEIPWLGKSYRQLAQTLGTEWGRNLIHTELWLKIAEQSIDSIMAKGLHAVVTDVRFENEAHFIRQKGGEVWHIQRGNIEKVNAHASEAGVKVAPTDRIIDNNGTLADLEHEVLTAFYG